MSRNPRSTVEHYLDDLTRFSSINSTLAKNVFADQAGRWRVSTPEPLGDYKLVNDNLPQFFDFETGGTATITYDADRKAHKIQTNADGDWAIVQTYQRHNYFAGKAQLIEFTQFDFEPEDNIEKRTAYYSSGIVSPYDTGIDGFYLNTKNGTHYITIVNKDFIIAEIPRNNWYDPLDGTGPSGYNINWPDFTVFQANFLWLGGTGLRIYCVVGSDVYLVNEYVHTGSINSNRLIFSSPNKPVRHEVRQTGSGSGTFSPICSTVITEGSEASASIGEVRKIDSGNTNNINISHPTAAVIKGMRLKETHTDATVQVLDAQPFVSTNNDFIKWDLVINPVITGTPVWTDVINYKLTNTGNDRRWYYYSKWWNSYRWWIWCKSRCYIKYHNVCAKNWYEYRWCS